jgi:hypothetical protein
MAAVTRCSAVAGFVCDEVTVLGTAIKGRTSSKNTSGLISNESLSQTEVVYKYFLFWYPKKVFEIETQVGQACWLSSSRHLSMIWPFVYKPSFQKALLCFVISSSSASSSSPYSLGIVVVIYTVKVNTKHTEFCPYFPHKVCLCVPF